MKYINKLLTLCLAFFFLTACLGDRKKVTVEEMEDTSFVNANFKGNKINLEKGKSACSNITATALGTIYDVSSDLVIVDDPVTNPARQVTDKPLCAFYIKSGESDYQWLRGSIALEREIDKDEMMGDIAEAIGNGENWEEGWALKKSMFKSIEWVNTSGKAAMWNGKEQSLAIKFDGYTLMVYPPQNRSNPSEVAKNRDYKKVALAIAKAGGYID